MRLCIYTHLNLTVQTANLDMTVQYNLLYNFVFFSMLYYLKGVYFLYKMFSLAVLAYFCKIILCLCHQENIRCFLQEVEISTYDMYVILLYCRPIYAADMRFLNKLKLIIS